MTALTKLDAGQVGEVLELRQSGGSAERLLAYGVAPGTHIRVHQRWPAYVIQVGETDLALDHDIAAGILVRVIE
ncbi:MAG: ferrous iron transport protein A [Candidatus Eisenbacteria bacterium]|nr:ferrous iron transport protein A [Candidatus Eisenbacteria bacterium]